MTELSISQNTESQMEDKAAINKRLEKEKLKMQKQRRASSPMRLTKPSPFQLHTDARASTRPAIDPHVLKEIQEKKEKTGTPIKARPMPDFSVPPKLPKAEEKKLVKVEPFKLASSVRHEEMVRQLEEKERNRLMQEEKDRQFKARPLPIFQDSDYHVKPSNKRLTDPKTPQVRCNNV